MSVTMTTDELGILATLTSPTEDHAVTVKEYSKFGSRPVRVAEVNISGRVDNIRVSSWFIAVTLYKVWEEEGTPDIEGFVHERCAQVGPNEITSTFRGLEGGPKHKKCLFIFLN